MRIILQIQHMFSAYPNRLSPSPDCFSFSCSCSCYCSCCLFVIFIEYFALLLLPFLIWLSFCGCRCLFSFAFPSFPSAYPLSLSFYSLSPCHSLCPSLQLLIHLHLHLPSLVALRQASSRHAFHISNLSHLPIAHTHTHTRTLAHTRRSRQKP